MYQNVSCKLWPALPGNATAWAHVHEQQEFTDESMSSWRVGEANEWLSDFNHPFLNITQCFLGTL